MLLRNNITLISQALFGFDEPLMQIAINEGVDCITSQSLQLFFPKTRWHDPSPQDIACLLHDGNRQLDGYLSNNLLIFQIPEAIQNLFWCIDFQQLLLRPNLDGYDYASTYRRVTAEASEYIINLLSLGNYAVHGRTDCKVVFNLPGLNSLRRDRTNGISLGLNFGDHEEEEVAFKGIVARINLGDEPRHLFYINISFAEMQRLLQLEGFSMSQLSRFGLAQTFMNHFSDYPVVRLTLYPRQGYLAYPANFIWDEGTQGMSEPDVNLCIYFNLTH